MITTTVLADRLADLTCDAWRIVGMQCNGEWGYTVPHEEIATLRRGMRNSTIVCVQGPGAGEVSYYLYAKLPDPLPRRGVR